MSTSTLPTKAWTRIFGSTEWDRAHALTPGVDGAIYVAGQAGASFDGQTNSGEYDAFLTKYDANSNGQRGPGWFGACWAMVLVAQALHSPAGAARVKIVVA
jgi:hypothetical protein